MPRKAQMNANYRKNERLLEDGQIDISVEAGGYTAGSGIAISEQKVISNTAQPAENTVVIGGITSQRAGAVVNQDGTYIVANPTDIGDALMCVPDPIDGHGIIGWGKPIPTIASGDAGKVLAVNSGETGVEWASIIAGGGYKYDTGTSIGGGMVSPNDTVTLTISDLDINKDYIIFTSSTNLNSLVQNTQRNNQNNIVITLCNKDSISHNITVWVSLFSRPKAGTTNNITVRGYIGRNCIFLPTGGTAGQVFKKTSGFYAEGSWQDISEVPSSTVSDAGKVLTVNSSGSAAWATPSGGSGLTAHTYNTYKELADDFVLHPDAILVSNNDIQLRLTDNNTKIRITTTYARYNESTPAMFINNIDETINIDSSLEVSSLALTIGYFTITTDNNTFTKSSINISVDSFKLLY